MTNQNTSPIRVRSVVLGVLGAVVVIVAVTAIVTLTSASDPAVALDPPTFVEEAREAGVVHTYDGDYPFIVGGGVATFDCNGDRFPDLYLAGGASPASLYRNVSAVGGSLQFEAVPSVVTDLANVTGSYPLDIDSDGLTDLVVLRVGPNAVLRGLGDCAFEDATDLLSVDPGDDWTVAFSATWEDDESLPTLAFGNYLGLDEHGEPTVTCADSYFVRPADTQPSYAAHTALTPGWCTLSMLFSDWNRSGKSDLRVTNDRHYYIGGAEQLWRVEPNISPVLYTEDDGWVGLRIWGMGISSQDVTGDGYPEVVLTSQGDNKLQTLIDTAAGPAYEDIALGRGATAHRPFAGDDLRQSTAWHPEFADVNNDGFVDLFITKGNVDSDPAYAAVDPSNLLIGQVDGTFVEGAEDAGIMRPGSARGASVVDLNMDGLEDLVQVIRKENVELWRNVGTGTASNPEPMGHWTALEFRQDGPNPDAVGAWVEIRLSEQTSFRELTIGGGHASGDLGWLHIGLGTADSAEVRVTWPDGAVGPWMTVPADQFRLVNRASNDTSQWVP